MKQDEHAVLELKVGGFVCPVGVMSSLDVPKEESFVVESVLVFGR